MLSSNMAKSPQSEIPKSSTNANGIILKVCFAIAKDMYQNVVTFHATNGMLDKNTDLTQSFVRSLLFIAQLRGWVLFTLARLFRRDFNLIPFVVRLNTLV